MNRKLLLLNLALLALAAGAGLDLRSRWLADRARAAAELHRAIRPIPPPPFTPASAPGAVLPADYLNVAQKDLFDRSRNPDVPVEAPPPPPPPPPMPPLPVYHGVMNLGDGPVAIMSLSGSKAQQAVKPGDPIGPFKLIDITRDDLTLEWNSQRIRKPLWELESRQTPEPVDRSSPAARTEQPAPQPAARDESRGPGEATTFGFKLCQPGDTDPVGTVKDGYKKVNVSTPFGSSCVWDPVAK